MGSVLQSFDHMTRTIILLSCMPSFCNIITGKTWHGQACAAQGTLRKPCDAVWGSCRPQVHMYLERRVGNQPSVQVGIVRCNVLGPVPAQEHVLLSSHAT